MPQYVYKCKECEKEMEIWHSMSERETDCKECGALGSLFKIPSLSKLSVNISSTKKVGAIVDDHIRQAKEEVRKEKIKLKNTEL